MPRSRMTPEQALAAIQAALNTRPDKKMPHRDLLEVLTAAGNQEAGTQILNLAANGQLVTAIDAQVNGRPVMTVTLPTGG